MLQVITLASMAVLVSAPAATSRTILYVDENATGPIHDGWTWCTAFTDLQDAVEIAAWDVTVRVAGGTYTPDQGTGDRGATFPLTTNVAVEGGYAGCGADDPDERDIELYETILSGDLAGDDVGGLDDPSRNENAYSVVTSRDTDETAVLDGFTITGGNGDGGIYNYLGSPTLTNCTISENSATFGGGMYNYNHCSPTLINCTFSGNTADSGGGGMFNGYYSNPTVTNCTFSENSARYGGGMHVQSGNPTLANCTFSGNSAISSGGGMYSYESSPTLTNCTFTANSAPNGRAVACDSWLQEYPGILELTNCIVWDGGDELWNNDGSAITISYTNVYGGWPGGNIFALPYFVDADGADDVPGTADDDLHLLPDSPCIDTGDPDFEPDPDETDLDGNPRVVNDRIDMGAYEYQRPCDDAEDCDDGDGCTDDACDPVVGCVHTAVECEAGYVCVDNSCQVVCEVMDADEDGDIDLRDYAVWQNCFSGPGE